jgi:hypothetical protein
VSERISLTLADLLAEAEALARPCIRLSAIPNGTEPVAVWGAERVLGAGHLLSLDLARLPLMAPPILPRRGLARLRAEESQEPTFALEDGPVDWEGLVESQPALQHAKNPYTGAALPPLLVWPQLRERAVFLFAYEDVSLPDIDSLFLGGSNKLYGWLGQHGWQPDWGYNNNFPASKVAGAYEREWQSRVWGQEQTSPVVGKQRTFAIIGGWRVPLIYEEHPRGDLVLTALASTEPLISVWQVEDRFLCDVQFT